MKRFQKKRGLHVDGVARPGGPTETNLNSALAEGLTQVRPVNAPSKPARRDEDDETRAAFGATPKKTDRPRNPQRSPLGVSPKRPKVFDVSAGVGQGQLNGRYDVRGAKHALAWAGYYPKDKAQTANGRVDDDLTWGIWDFQRDHKLKRDGYMLPGGETATALNALVAPLVRAAFGAAERPDQATGFQESRDGEDPPAEDPPARTPEDGGGSDEGEGDDKEEPDTNHGRKFAEYQRRLNVLEAELEKWTEDWLFLNNNDITQLDGPEKDRYLGLIRDYTGYVVPTEPPSAPPTPGQTPHPNDKNDNKGRRITRGIWDLLPPLLEEGRPIITDPDWVEKVREKRDEAVEKLQSWRDRNTSLIPQLLDQANKEGCFPESPSGTHSGP
jgi:peptidoglycan hydrolase-like protein with peptidoglycan-binding domain